MADEPEERTTFSPEQTKRVLDWIDTHWKGSKLCPICTQNDWLLGNNVVQPITQEPIGRINPLGATASYPGVLLICKVCGYTMTFNAVVIGLLQPRQKAETSNVKP